MMPHAAPIAPINWMGHQGGISYLLFLSFHFLWKDNDKDKYRCKDNDKYKSIGWTTNGEYPISSFCHFTFYEKTMTRTNTDAKTMRNTNKLDRKFCAMGILYIYLTTSKWKWQNHICAWKALLVSLNDAKYLKFVWRI